VAELTAAYLCAELGIANTPRQDHAQYIAHWLEVLKDDKKAIFAAASLASRAVDYLFSLQSPSPTPEPDEKKETHALIGEAAAQEIHKPPGDAEARPPAKRSRLRDGQHEMTWTNPIDGSAVLLRITHRRDYFEKGTDHLAIESIAPEKAPTPITETGYLSHFMSAEALREAGGPVRYVEEWLARAGQAKEWRQHELKRRQGNLFQWADAQGEVGPRDSAPKTRKPSAPKKKPRARPRSERDLT
jgi:hypothetical protein